MRGLMLVFSILWVTVYGVVIVKDVDASEYPVVKVYISSSEDLPTGGLFILEDGIKVPARLDAVSNGSTGRVNFVFVIDTSGSMMDDVEEVLKQVKSFPMGDLQARVAFVVFGNKGRTKVLKLKGRIFMDPEDIDRVKDRIFSEDLGAIEAQMEGVKIALGILKDQINRDGVYNFVILMTDEGPFTYGSDLEYNRELARDMEKDFQNFENVLFMALLTDDASKDEDFKRFVRRIWGAVMDLSGGAAARRVAEKLKRMASKSYVLTFVSLKIDLDGSWVTVEAFGEKFRYRLPKMEW